MDLIGGLRLDYRLGGIDDGRQRIFVGRLRGEQDKYPQAASDILITHLAAQPDSHQMYRATHQTTSVPYQARDRTLFVLGCRNNVFNIQIYLCGMRCDDVGLRSPPSLAWRSSTKRALTSDNIRKHERVMSGFRDYPHHPDGFLDRLVVSSSGFHEA